MWWPTAPRHPRNCNSKCVFQSRGQRGLIKSRTVEQLNFLHLLPHDSEILGQEFVTLEDISFWPEFPDHLLNVWALVSIAAHWFSSVLLHHSPVVGLKTCKNSHWCTEQVLNTVLPLTTVVFLACDSRLLSMDVALLSGGCPPSYLKHLLKLVVHHWGERQLCCPSSARW